VTGAEQHRTCLQQNITTAILVGVLVLQVAAFCYCRHKQASYVTQTSRHVYFCSRGSTSRVHMLLTSSPGPALCCGEGQRRVPVSGRATLAALPALTAQHTAAIQNAACWLWVTTGVWSRMHGLVFGVATGLVRQIVSPGLPVAAPTFTVLGLCCKIYLACEGSFWGSFLRQHPVANEGSARGSRQPGSSSGSERHGTMALCLPAAGVMVGSDPTPGLKLFLIEGTHGPRASQALYLESKGTCTLASWVCH
jgi:hypothetical protein